MTIGILLLTYDNYYVKEDNSLPQAPSWDKQFLLNICENQKVVCSEETYRTLPKSIKNISRSIAIGNQPFGADVNLGIDTFDRPVSLLLIVRSQEHIIKGKQFSLNKYKQILVK